MSNIADYILPGPISGVFSQFKQSRFQKTANLQNQYAAECLKSVHLSQQSNVKRRVLQEGIQFDSQVSKYLYHHTLKTQGLTVHNKGIKETILVALFWCFSNFLCFFLFNSFMQSLFVQSVLISNSINTLNVAA